MVWYETQTMTIAEEESLSDILDVRRVTGIWFVMPAEWTDAVLGFKVSPTLTGTFTPPYDTAGDRVGITLQVDGVQVAPAGIVGAGFIKLWSRTAGDVDVEQEAERVFTVILRAVI